MAITRTGACPLFLEYATKQALIPRTSTPTPQFIQLTQFNFRWIDIPSYQRGLVWDEETFEELLNSPSIFLGNAILGAFPIPNPRGVFIHVPQNASHYEILIDGLQRFSIGTALLSIMHTLVLADHPLKAAEAPHFAALRAQTLGFAAVFQHNDNELQNHHRKAVRISYVEFRQTLANWIESEFDQGRAQELANKIQHLFLQRQISPDTYYGFQSEYDVASTFIGLNTIRVQLNIVDWLRSIIVERGSLAGWNSTIISAIDNRFTEVFTRGTNPEPELMPFASIVLDALTDRERPQRAVAAFPSWLTALAQTEVNSFLDFVEALKSTTSNPFFRELRQCGRVPFAGCLAYYYRLFLTSGTLPSFVNGGNAEDSELHAYLRANYRVLFCGRIWRTRHLSERLLHDSVTLFQVADEVSDFATGRNLGAQVDSAWLTATLKNTDQGRAARVFNACLLPPTTNPATFAPQVYGRKGNVYQVDHMIPESVIDTNPNEPGEPEARSLRNFAPIRRSANNAQSNLTCSGKLAAGGSYANECVNDPNVHPYIQWLVSNQAVHGAFLDQMERLQPLATPPFAEDRIGWLVNRLLPRL